MPKPPAGRETKQDAEIAAADTEVGPAAAVSDGGNEFAQGAFFEVPITGSPKQPTSKASASKATELPSDKPGYHGHRQRLRARFMKTSDGGMEDYELLELLLFRAIQRRDTKDLSKRLLKRFGSFAEVINAPEQRLREVRDVGDAVVIELKLVRAAALRLMQSEIIDRPVLSSWAQVLDYCRAAMAYEEREQFRVLYLDKKNRLIADELQSQGTIDHTPVYVREVVKRALENSASAILLVHNHPSGDPHPSRADIEMTRQIVNAAKPLGITVHDHIIVGRDGHASFRGLGLMAD